MNRRGRPKHPDILTPREWEVLALLREELSNDAIAERLGISVDGVKFHVAEILSKLSVHNRREAAEWNPDQRPWWMTAAAPFLFWRKMSFGWLSRAVAGAVGVLVLAGISFFIWALIATGDDTKPPPSRNTERADGVPSTFLIGSDLIPIEPATGQELAGYEYDYAPFARGLAVISPNGSTAALTNLWVINERQMQKLSLFDVKQWKEVAELGFFADIQELRWSPDGSRLYLLTFDGCAEIGLDESVPLCKSRILTIDVANGSVIATGNLPSEYGRIFGGSTVIHVGPGGRILYLFQSTTTVDTTGEPSSVASIVAFDLATGNVRNDLALPDVLWDVRPGVVVSPDGRRAYIVHADSDRVTVVDLREMRIERSEEIGRSAALFERFLSFLAGSAYAKGPPREKWTAISPDGRYLYISGMSERTVNTPEGEVLEQTSLGLWVIDTNSLDIVAEIEPGGEVVYSTLVMHPSGRYLYAYADRLFVLDPTTLKTIAVRNLGVPWSRSLVVAPARPLAVEAP